MTFLCGSCHLLPLLSPLLGNPSSPEWMGHPLCTRQRKLQLSQWWEVPENVPGKDLAQGQDLLRLVPRGKKDPRAAALSHEEWLRLRELACTCVQPMGVDEEASGTAPRVSVYFSQASVSEQNSHL